MDELLDSAPCGFLSFSDDGTVQLINGTLLGMLGYQREDVIGYHIEQLFNVGTRIFYQTHWFPLLRLHGHAEEVFLMLRTREGVDIGMLSYARRNETDARYDCVFVRVSERAKYEQELLNARRAAEAANNQLQQLAAEAAEANRAKSSFLAMMSHELRTPLNAISGYLQILELEIAGPITDAQRDILDRLDRSGRHLLNLINDVLDISRIEAGRVDYQLLDADLTEIVAGVTPMVEPQLASKGIAFRVDVAPGLRVRADTEKLQQILVNLLGNAAKFTPSGGTVELRSATQSVGGKVTVRVRDTGIGIPNDQLETIFQPFVQVESRHARKVQGSGLGLAISRDLARGMGGDLTATSVLGEGSTFTLILNAAAAPRKRDVENHAPADMHVRD